MSLRRLGILGGLALGWIVLAAWPVAAEELSDYLEEADRAVYSGREVVFTVWEGYSSYAVLDIEHADGMLMITRRGDSAMVGKGKLLSLGEPDAAIQFTQSTQTHDVERYEVVTVGAVQQAGRWSRVVEVMEHGVLRARMKFDLATSAPMGTEVFAGGGELFRYASMVDFRPATSMLRTDNETDEPEYMMTGPADGLGLPVTVAHYGLVDTYIGPDGAAQGFYADGLFSFSLFLIDGRADLDTMGESSIHNLGGSDYRVTVAPTEMWVMWTTGSDTYVIVGDLPPDHLEQVLAEFPRPVRWNWFQRVWHNIFG